MVCPYSHITTTNVAVTEHEEMGVGEGRSAAVADAARVLRLVVDAARQHRQRAGASLPVLDDLHAVHAHDDDPVVVVAAPGVHQPPVDVPADGRRRPAAEEDREDGRVAGRDRLVLESERERRRLDGDGSGSVQGRPGIDRGRRLQRKHDLDSGRERLRGDGRREDGL